MGRVTEDIERKREERDREEDSEGGREIEGEKGRREEKGETGTDGAERGRERGSVRAAQR